MRSSNCSGVLQIGLGQHGELALRALDAAGRHLDVLAAERVLDVLRRQVVGGEPLGIEPDAHGISPLAEDGAPRRRRGRVCS